MTSLFEAAKELQNYFDSKNLPFCFIGGIAVLRWGEIRLTNDVDVTLLCGFGNERELSKNILSKYKPRISNALDFAIANRVVLITSSNGIQVDVSLSGLPFEEDMIKRSSCFEIYPSIQLRTCNAEDLIIMKAFSNRDKDWSDISAVIKRNAGTLNSDYILTSIIPLAGIKEDKSIIEKLKRLLNK